MDNQYICILAHYPVLLSIGRNFPKLVISFHGTSNQIGRYQLLLHCCSFHKSFPFALQYDFGGFVLIHAVQRLNQRISKEFSYLFGCTIGKR